MSYICPNKAAWKAMYVNRKYIVQYRMPDHLDGGKKSERSFVIHDY